MVALLLTLTGLALLDALDVLLVGVTAAVVYDARVRRRSPIAGGLSFIAGVFVVTTTFGLLTVLGLGFLTDLVDFEMTPAIRYRGALALGIALVAIAAIPVGERKPPAWAARFRGQPWLLAMIGLIIGLAQAPTAVPYLAGLAMISARQPLPEAWPLIIVAYCLLALVLPLLLLLLATRKSPRARRGFRRLTRLITRYGPPIVRALFLIIGCGLIVLAAVHLSDVF